MPIQVNVTMPEIYNAVCPKCKKVLEKLVKDKVETDVAKHILEGKE